MSISASEARQKLFPLIEQVNTDRVAVEIVSRKGNAVLMPAEEYAAWQETAYLFRSPANARRLLEAYEQAKAGDVESHDLVITEA
ncbi:type II toxin-antitoxin system Phd/YefM family antitoxin [Arachnia propionica]|uniref:Antitoxin n=1 Tax=Arachnia propionica TaxID=1750 RepID=A0A3P1WPF9_9ACTN|nr:type II toxin-antitoxin system prevent-host-death family antitoxin [Arachnia propionica]RRD48135.1 type II toxin-antitoxin system prevent-host-death family antitoxin [Arachnia propionica]